MKKQLTVSKLKKKPSKSSLKKAHFKMKTIFNRFVRHRDCDNHTGWGSCISCRKPYPIEKLQAGHYLHDMNATRYDEMNVNAQCTHCNYWRSGESRKYKESLIEKYGEKAVEELEQRHIPGKKFTVEELEELIVKYKHKLREVENGN